MGVIIIPKKFFQINNEAITQKELIERHRLILLLKHDEERVQRQRYLDCLYGSVLLKDNIDHEDKLLRESLSLHGQLALLAAYKDTIEGELNENDKCWKSIPIQSNGINSFDCPYHAFKSLAGSDSFRTKRKSNQTHSSIKSDTDLSLTTNNYLLKISLPDQIDKQWQRKSIVHVIEQGMDLLDIMRSLSSIKLLNIYLFPSEQLIQDVHNHIKKTKFC